MPAMSSRAFGARTSAMSSPALRDAACLDLGFNSADELRYGLAILENNALALIDLAETLFGGLPQCSQFCPPFLLLFFQKAQSLTDDLAGVAVSPRGNLAFDKMV